MSHLLAPYVEAGVLGPADVQVARALPRLGGLADPSLEVLLGVAMAVRAVRHGSVCLELAEVADSVGIEDADDVSLARLAALHWPDPTEWSAALVASGLVGGGSGDAVGGVEVRPLHLHDGRLYLDRYWRQERRVAEIIDARGAMLPSDLDESALSTALDRLFPGPADSLQRQAAHTAARQWISVLAGGPGTGKTTTVAKLLAVLAAQPGVPPRIALAAPTGKAAARLEEAVRSSIASFSTTDRERLGEPSATTLHRMLGWTPQRNRFKHDADNRLPFDVVVVDEASMVALTMMSRLVDALRPEARLILVGDPDQLASVEAGAVLRDLTERPSLTGHVVTLTRVHRFTATIQALASAIRDGDADAVVNALHASADVTLVVPEGPAVDRALVRAEWPAVRADVVAAGAALAEAAEQGDAARALDALERHRILCAHLDGPYGVARWSRYAEDWLRADDAGHPRFGTWYAGRPLLVTSNDRDLGLYNGDTGVVVRGPEGRLVAAFRDGQGVRLVATNRLAEVVTVNAMSIHKSQGSQFDVVTVVLPDPTSPLLTRELFYTAVTRAKTQVRVIGTEDSVRAAVARRIQRASGLGG